MSVTHTFIAFEFCLVLCSAFLKLLLKFEKAANKKGGCKSEKDEKGKSIFFNIFYLNASSSTQFFLALRKKLNNKKLITLVKLYCTY